MNSSCTKYDYLPRLPSEFASIYLLLILARAVKLLVAAHLAADISLLFLLQYMMT